MARRAAIVGAGLSGLAAARRLTDAGLACTLIDKSRGLGGRMATRRIDGLQFNHGLPLIEAARPALRAALADWIGAGIAAPWAAGAVGLPGMTAPARALARGIPVLGGCTVTGLARGPGGWTLLEAGGPVAVEGNGAFDAVLLALPAPQAAPLAEGAGLPPGPLARVEYAPCWTLLEAHEGPPPDGSRDRHPAVGPFARILRDSDKPGRPGGPWTRVAHATAAWTRAHLELDRDAVAALLSAHLDAAEGPGRPPLYRAAHRWRHARVTQGAPVDCLWMPDIGLGACGDWALGAEAVADPGAAQEDRGEATPFDPRRNGAETAFESGLALAEAVLATPA